jgi:hypothetical protein
VGNGVAVELHDIMPSCLCDEAPRVGRRGSPTSFAMGCAARISCFTTRLLSSERGLFGFRM